MSGNRSKSAFFEGVGHFERRFQRERGVGTTNHSWYQSNRVIALSCGIKISAVRHLVLSQCMRVTDGQNYDSQDRPRICSRGKNFKERRYICCGLAGKLSKFGVFTPSYWFRRHFTGSGVSKLLLPSQPRRVAKFLKRRLIDVEKSGDGKYFSKKRSRNIMVVAFAKDRAGDHNYRFRLCFLELQKRDFDPSLDTVCTLRERTDGVRR